MIRVDPNFGDFFKKKYFIIYVLYTQYKFSST